MRRVRVFGDVFGAPSRRDKERHRASRKYRRESTVQSPYGAELSMPQLGDDPVAHRRRRDRSDRPSSSVGRNPNIAKMKSALPATSPSAVRSRCTATAVFQVFRSISVTVTCPSTSRWRVAKADTMWNKQTARSAIGGWNKRARHSSVSCVSGSNLRGDADFLKTKLRILRRLAPPSPSLGRFDHEC